MNAPARDVERLLPEKSPIERLTTGQLQRECESRGLGLAELKRSIEELRAEFKSPDIAKTLELLREKDPASFELLLSLLYGRKVAPKEVPVERLLPDFSAFADSASVDVLCLAAGYFGLHGGRLTEASERVFRATQSARKSLLSHVLKVHSTVLTSDTAKKSAPAADSAGPAPVKQYIGVVPAVAEVGKILEEGKKSFLDSLVEWGRELDQGLREKRKADDERDRLCAAREHQKQDALVRELAPNDPQVTAIRDDAFESHQYGGALTDLERTAILIKARKRRQAA